VVLAAVQVALSESKRRVRVLREGEEGEWGKGAGGGGAGWRRGGGASKFGFRVLGGGIECRAKGVGSSDWGFGSTV
jgi:hypothetical protein